MGMMINRRRVMGGKKLVEIEYLESTGTQWIDTGVIPSRDLSFHCIFNTSENVASGYYGNVFGARRSSQVNEYQLSLYNNGLISIGKRSINLGFYRHIKNDISFDGGNTVSINGSDKSITTSEFTMNVGTIVLFAIRDNGNITQYQAGKIYSCSFGSVRDFIPVRIGNVGYMYDKVSGQLFGNSGTGKFILGPDKVTGGVNTL